MSDIGTVTYVGEEGDEEESCHQQHGGQADQHQGLTSSLLNEDQRDDGHQDIHGSHAQGGSLALLLVKPGLLEDVCGVKHCTIVEQTKVHIFIHRYL